MIFYLSVLLSIYPVLGAHDVFTAAGPAGMLFDIGFRHMTAVPLGTRFSSVNAQYRCDVSFLYKMVSVF